MAYGQVLNVYNCRVAIQKENCYLREWNTFVQNPNVYPVIHLQGLAKGSTRDSQSATDTSSNIASGEYIIQVIKQSALQPGPVPDLSPILCTIQN